MMSVTPFKKYVTLKECIVRVATNGMIILDLDYVVENKSHFLPNKQIVYHPVWEFGAHCFA